MKTPFLLFTALLFLVQVAAAQNHASVIVIDDLPEAVADYATTRAGESVVIKPLLNDIQNSYDTLIMSLAYAEADNPGYLEFHDSVVIYTPSYQAEGVQKLHYHIKAETGFMPAAKGEIFVTVMKQNYYDSLTINNISAGVSASGNLFNFHYEMPGDLMPNNLGEFQTYFRVPAEGNAHTIFSNFFQLGGYDGQGNLHMSADLSDWIAGPVADNRDTTFVRRYSNVWKLSRQEVEYHMNNYWKPDYEPVWAISSWPGNGNTANGEAALLAPFYDADGDGEYNWSNGDYPLIRGDECIFLMCNDYQEQSDTTALPLKVELHAMVYAFDEPADTALFNTIFVHYDLINRSTETYTDCYAGILADFDIGYVSDDRFRTDVTRASVYSYNGVDIDGAGEYWAYGDHPPAQSLTILAGPFMDNDGVDNPSGGCDESVNGINFGNGVMDDERHGLSRGIRYSRINENSYYNQPTLADYYGYLNGFWNDGTAIMFGGGGHADMGAAGPESRFMFTGDSDPLNWGTGCVLPNGGYNQNGLYWTEELENLVPTDERALASMGPFTFAPDEVQEIELAYCTGLGTGGALSSVNQLLRNIDALRSAAVQGKIIIPNDLLGMNPAGIPSNVTLYPNPASETIGISGLMSNKAEFVVFNLYGTVVSEGRLAGARPTVNVNDLAPGMYIIRITDGKQISTGKFMKR